MNNLITDFIFTLDYTVVILLFFVFVLRSWFKDSKSQPSLLLTGHATLNKVIGSLKATVYL